MANNRNDGRFSLMEWAAVGAVLLTAVCLQVGTLRKPFFADDYLFLEQVRGRSLGAVLATPDPLGNFFRPVSRQLYFWVLTRLGGESPALFHAVGLLLFLTSLTTLYLIARRLMGRTGAVFAIAFVGLHYSADVPLRWASGSQDLLGVLFATLAIYLHSSGKRAVAPLALVLALLSKEAVAGAALVAIAHDRRQGESWKETFRRGRGLLGVTAAWGVWWISSLGARPVASQSLSLTPDGLVAACVHLLQTIIGAEFRLGGGAIGHWSLIPLVPAAVAAAVLWWTGGRSEGGQAQSVQGAGGGHRRADAVLLGTVWTVAAVLPIVLVTPIWSAYFYLWAICGVALVLGAMIETLPVNLGAAVLAALVFLSGEARALDEFSASGGAWSRQSHVNRHYVDRSLATVQDYLRQMRAARPTLSPRTTVFFANVPTASGWQAADGPLLRWAYRDSSIRSYFLTQYSKARAARGPVLFFAAEGDSLRDKTADPQLLPSFAFSMLLADKPRAAVDALDAALVSNPTAEGWYWRGLARWATGDSAGAVSDLQRAGMTPARELPPGADQVVVGAGADTARRIVVLRSLRNSAALNPWVHARLASILLAQGNKVEGAIEAFSYRVLAPADPDAWRKWASAQLAEQQFRPALASLEHYIALSGARGQTDREAQIVVESLRRLVDGDVAQQALRSSGGS